MGKCYMRYGVAYGDGLEKATPRGYICVADIVQSSTHVPIQDCEF